eukprot:scaffold2911_cov414-Prasinococcus_capsulatus_cf.AAC.46
MHAGLEKPSLRAPGRVAGTKCAPLPPCTGPKYLVTRQLHCEDGRAASTRPLARTRLSGHVHPSRPPQERAAGEKGQAEAESTPQPDDCPARLRSWRRRPRVASPAPHSRGACQLSHS